MLTNLHVKNLALIEEADVEFGPGLNILTGETGAGKSILMGAVNLALGKKASRDLIREGADYCLVELIFQVENPGIREALGKQGIETEEGQLIVSRKITGSRSLGRINGESCTAAQIRAAASLLLDIHGQHEHQSLLYRERQLEILDAYGRERLRPCLEETALQYDRYRKLKKELDGCRMDEAARARETALLEFEIQEIEEAALIPGEEEELEKSYRRMSNSRKIAEALGAVHQLTGNDGGAGDLTGRALRELSGVSAYDEALAGLEAGLTDIDNLLGDFNREAAAYLSSFTFSEEEFYQTEKRLDQLNHLKTKYGNSIEKILEYQSTQRERLEKLQHLEERREKLEEELRAAEKSLDAVTHKVSDLRAGYCQELTEKITEALTDLNFLEVTFRIQLTRRQDYGRNGRDEVEFMISTNPGEEPKPLSRVVSGGELSRIMLAIKTILADRDSTETLIFDEIDTGISGRTAQRVSEKMAEIGRNHQVICITHLAQIAAMADTHFEISKKVENQETVTKIRKLNRNESVTELARILGGAEITKAVLESAGEMKDLADQQKTSRLK
ncbi:MAG TPA: DNA repair protein RecN [Candidatus Scatomonas pullistercoris]|uniref:DNA repair protein RecN n=1 Tax=Candidatus Scatomonas pullistercoris TaxID=2840920 RepID=A0A9D1T9Y3_9FIRM|nr:DNA repair protein RecN [Candidatus Scatomonas pullistercoris]